MLLLLGEEPDLSVPEGLREVLRDFEAQIASPLRSAASGVEWTNRIGRLRSASLLAQLELGAAALQDPEFLVQLQTFLERFPAGLKVNRPEDGVARSAVEHAASVYLAFVRPALDGLRELDPAKATAESLQEAFDYTRAQLSAAARRPVAFSRALGVLDDILVLGLCLLTTGDGPAPAPTDEVAEAAAWEAYARARRLTMSSPEPRAVPEESPAGVRERASAMLRRVSRRWSDEVRSAVEDARLFPSAGE